MLKFIVKFFKWISRTLDVAEHEKEIREVEVQAADLSIKRQYDKWKERERQETERRRAAVDRAEKAKFEAERQKQLEEKRRQEEEQRRWDEEHPIEAARRTIRNMESEMHADAMFIESYKKNCGELQKKYFFKVMEQAEEEIKYRQILDDIRRKKATADDAETQMIVILLKEDQVRYLREMIDKMKKRIEKFNRIYERNDRLLTAKSSEIDVLEERLEACKEANRLEEIEKMNIECITYITRLRDEMSKQEHTEAVREEINKAVPGAFEDSSSDVTVIFEQRARERVERDLQNGIRTYATP